MAQMSLNEFSSAATLDQDPSLTSPYLPRLGGVDPLGLRQINFDLMDVVLPGLNNVASHIRPFTVVAWAWRHAATLARDLGQSSISVDVLRDFVDRIEVIYAWSQFQRKADTDLPGRDYLADLIKANQYTFGGNAWKRRREAREYSTALSAPVNYGPGLKSLGWMQSDAGNSGALAVRGVADEAIAAFEHELGPCLSQPALSTLGEVTVTASEVIELGKAWAIEHPTQSERTAFLNCLSGEHADPRRRSGVDLIIAAVRHLDGNADPALVRKTMCGLPTTFAPPTHIEATAKAWRVLQVRQVFRLALESLFHWVLLKLRAEPMITSALVESFLGEAGDAETTELWFTKVGDHLRGPCDWLDALRKSLLSGNRELELPGVIRGALAACIQEAPPTAGAENNERLPLSRAAKEAYNRVHSTPRILMTHVLDSWVIGQHVFWSVNRGMGDARAGRRMILRLRIALEEGGWTLTPGSAMPIPNATPDRLETALSLLREAGAL